MSVKHEYVSKLEQLADASGKSEEKTVSRKKRTEKEDKEERRKPTFDPKKRDYEFKPIYSEEELAEIARQEEEDSQVLAAAVLHDTVEDAGRSTGRGRACQ